MYNSGLSTVKIGKILNIHYSRVRDILIRNGVTLRSNKINSRKYHVDHNYFKEIDNEEKAYWLGFIYADGYISSAEKSKKIGISLSDVDKEHLQKFNKSINSDYPIKEYTSESGYSVGNKYCRTLITSENLYDDLLRHGVYEHKSLILNPPNITDDLKRHFIRGYLDGDGTISHNGNSYYVGFVGTKMMLEWIYEYAKENNIKFNFRIEKRKEECEAYSFKIHGYNAYKFLEKIYSDSSIYLNRKYRRYKEAIIYFSRLYQE